MCIRDRLKPVVHHQPYPDVLQCWKEVDGRRVQVACEYAVEETPVDEPEYMAQEETDQLSDSAREERVELWSGTVSYTHLKLSAMRLM